MPAPTTPAEDIHAGPLAGIRVVEFCALIAGPSCARYLADHGAEVIKIERYPLGDSSRGANNAGVARSAMYVQHNGGKKGLCVDLTQPDGLVIALDLIRRADVVIEAFTPGVMARLGLGYEALKAINPKLVMCSISGFGQTGPNSARPGYAHVAHSMAGWIAMQFLHRDPPEVPRGPGIAIADVVTGITAFGAICAALFRRERTGRGEYLDVALFDSLFAANDESLQRCLIDGVVNVWHHPVYKTQDGFVTANIGPDYKSWQSICKVVGRLDLLADPRFLDQPSLTKHIAQAIDVLRAWLLQQTSADADRILTEHHVVCGVVKTVPEVIRQPQVLERGLITGVDDPVLGYIEVVNSAVKFREATVGVRGHAPMVGEHNESVLRDLLGFDAQRIAKLREQGVLRELNI